MHQALATQNGRGCGSPFAALLLLFSLPYALYATPPLSFDQERVASAVTPGESVAWLWVARRLNGYVSELALGAEQTFDDDRDGVVTLTNARAAWPASLFVAVDTMSGAFVLGTPGGGFVQPSVLAPVEVGRSSSGTFSRLAFAGHRAEVLLVRLGVGAWHLSLADGSVHDADGVQDGMIGIAVASLEVLGEAVAPPTELKKDDLLVVLDPARMTVSVLALSEESVHWDDGEAKPAEPAR